MFFKSLRNLLRCTFCRRKTFCGTRYQIGTRHYYSGFGFVSSQCPKELERTVPFYGMTVKEIREHMKKTVKEEEKH